MDKALIRIKNLEEVLEVLQSKNLENTKEIVRIVQQNCSLEEQIDFLEDSNKQLNEEKSFSQEAPKKRKRDKKDFISSIILTYVVGTIIALIPICIGNGNFSLMLPCIGASTLLTAAVSSVIVPLQFKTINRRYPIKNIENIENSILENNKKLEILSNEKQSVAFEEESLAEKRKDFESKIREIKTEIENIASLRHSIIHDYCTNNPELDAKIDEGYEKNPIQKTK